MRIIQRLINNGQFEQALRYAEELIYQKAYEHSGNNQSLTARLLGVSRGTVITKLKLAGRI